LTDLLLQHYSKSPFTGANGNTGKQSYWDHSK